MLIHHNLFKIINKGNIFITFIIIGLLFIAWNPFEVLATTFISGDIYNGAHWTNAGSPYVVSGRIIIRSGIITIDPGVVIKFMPDSFVVGGGLMAKGTLIDPIIFTSIKDDAVVGDTNGDGDISSPMPGDWGNLTLSGANLENVIIRYGGGRTPNYQGVIAVFNGSVSLINSNIYSNYLGIRQYGGVLEMDNNKIDANTQGFELFGGIANINNVEISKNNIGISVANYFHYPHATLNLNNSKIIDNGWGLSVSGGVVKIQNSIFKNNKSGLNIVGNISCSICNLVDFSILNSEINNNQIGIQTIYGDTLGNVNIRYNSIHDNFNYGIYQDSLQKNVDAVLNWWGDKTGPFHSVLNPNGKGNKISDHVFFMPWIGLENFWSQLQKLPSGWLNLRKTPGIQNKPSDDIIKTLPNGWAVKVASTTDENGNFIDRDNYRWYKVEDVTDRVIGWMAAKNLTDGTAYLDYDSNSQLILEQNAAVQLDTSDKRKPVILQAVDSFYTTSTTNSLYSPAGGFDGNNNFQKFIQGANFSKEIILAILAQESGSSFDNETCSQAKDGGIGIMQITSPSFKGLGSGLDNKSRKNDCTAGWISNFSKYYSNALQGIYANIKDGFRVFQEKYRQKCPKESEIIDGYTFTCQDIEKILDIWAYNGFAKDKDTGIYTGNYLKYISDKLKNLSIYFTGVIYNNSDYLVEKLRIANNNKQIIRLYSPGELQVIDSKNRITGLVNGVIKEDIPNSLYEKDIKGVAVFLHRDVNRYRVIGIDNGFYNLSIDYTKAGILITFRVDNIPISINEIHEYFIDWDALFKSEIGVTVEIDQNGDGIADKIFVSGDTFNQTDIFLQNNTIIDFEPSTLNIESSGIATVYIELPIGYDVNNISTSSIRLNKVIHASSKPIEVGDYDKDGISDLMVKFAREEIKPTVSVGEKIPITISGKIFHGENYYYFMGLDEVGVVGNKTNNKSNLTSIISQFVSMQKIFNNLEEKIVAVFYKIIR